MAVGLHVTVRYEGPIEGKIRDFYPVLTRALRSEAERWFKETLPGHFNLGAAKKYDYTPRDFKYGRQKTLAKERGWVRDPELKMRVPLGDPQLPALVWTGRTRDMVTSQSVYLTYQKKVTLKMRAPHYIFKLQNMQWRPKAVDEITAMTPAEQADQAERIGQAIREHLAARTPVEVRRIA